ncbi:LETM1-related biofilm-associated protein [Winogradskyella sp. A3E31]|uniref:LETM1-related biofilm-associated protein n=1 Tax=Winogradskyella sp. A3E31 TaxID=3349637 RepID=UPI00398A6425
MNPSAKGWIKKLFKILPESFFNDMDDDGFYTALKETGFIYGSNLSILKGAVASKDFTEEECCKVNLILALYYIHTKKESQFDFIKTVSDFYATTEDYKSSFISEVFGFGSSKPSLEDIIHRRIHIDDNIITKHFNSFLINALLFVDVLAYQHFLDGDKNLKGYILKVEAIIETITVSILSSKKHKAEYEAQLLKLFEASLRHKDNSKLEMSDFTKTISTDFEKKYLIDTTCMASWTDKHIDDEEYGYLKKLQSNLQLDPKIITESIDDLNTFYKTNKDKIAFLSDNTLAQNFYENNSKLVIRLIKRNSKRLFKELTESKEAMVLLTKSTQRNLTDEEQKKVQEQLLDIFKSIPSLAIFMLPGGMLLLPLFIKFIPKLLPSAFDDNRIEE